MDVSIEILSHYPSDEEDNSPPNKQIKINIVK